MFVKFVSRLVMLTAFFALTAFGLVACQLNTQEAVDAEPPLKLAGPMENCLGDSLGVIENYFKGVSKVGEVDSAFECFAGALELFQTHGRGSSSKDSFSASELRSFLHAHFLKNHKISDSLLTEVMRVKQSILGGAADRLTKKEIASLLEVLETLRIEANRLRPYIDIINQRVPMDSQVDPSILEQALSDFTYTMETLGELLGKSHQTYRLDNLQTLLLDFQGLYSGRSDWRGPQWFSEQMPLFVAAKALLIRPDGASIAPSEWRLLFSHIGRIYGLYLRFKYAMSDRDLFHGDGLAQIEIAVLEITGILDEAIHAKTDGKISYQILTDFINAIGNSGSFDLPLQTATLEKLLTPLLERVLNPIVVTARTSRPIDPKDPLSAKGERIPQGGLTKANLDRAKSILLGWVETQQFWDRLETEAVKQDPSLAGKPIPLKIVRPMWAAFSPVYPEPWEDLKSIFDRPYLPSTRANGTLIFESSKTIAYDRASFDGLNWKQQIVRTIGYGYVSDPNGLRIKGITEDQFKLVFDDLYLLAVDLGFLDKSDGDIWKTGFSISNIFLFSSNGDDRIGYHEATDLFMFSFASSVIREKVHAKVLAECPHQPVDRAGKVTIKASCWRKWLKKDYLTYFADLPGWIKQANRFDADGWERFLDNIEKAARKADNPSGPLTQSEMSRAISIHHYMEALFTRWDANGTGRLSRSEGDKALFLFKRILKDASGFDDDEEVRALFHWLLAYGEPPDDGDLGDIIKWLWWKSNPDVWDSRVEATRERIAQIFGNLAAEL